MERNFSIQEILKVAIGVEENGSKLYQIMERNAQDEKTKRMWVYLKEQEKEHAGIFQGMLDKVGDSTVDFSPDEQYSAYIKAVASEFILTQEVMAKKVDEEAGSTLEAIEFAIQVEKDSILTYSALKEYVLTKNQDVLDKIIIEERQHLAELVQLKDQL